MSTLQNPVFLALAFILLVGVIYGLFRIQWLLFVAIKERTEKFCKMLANGINGLAEKCATVWSWICGKPQEKSVSQTTSANNPYPLEHIFSGIISFFVVIVACITDFYALKLAWEIVFIGLEQVPGSINFAAISAITMLVAIVMSGAIWRDAEFFVQKSKVKDASKYGYWGLVALIFIAVFLAMLRALIIGQLNMIVAVINGISTGVISFVVAFAFSIAFRNFLHPLGQRAVFGIEKRFSILGTIIRFICGLVFWVVLVAMLLIVGLVYLIFQIPPFLLDLKERYDTWKGEYQIKRVSIRREKAARRLSDIASRGESQRTQVMQDYQTNELKRKIRQANQLGITLEDLEEMEKRNGRIHDELDEVPIGRGQKVRR